ncbi:elongation of very long chain fatty acids protein [Acrasis kona]|uniref:Elongation of fatty acids protein n=1 Tax=Acrasis kona TaxID=1008807 RepID=A0AAW2Z369_9EUKA
MATNATTIPIVNSFVDRYKQIFSHKYESMYIVQQYPNTFPLTFVALYVSMVFLLPKVLVRIPATKEGLNLGRLMSLWNLFLSIWSAAMVLGAGIPYGLHLLTHGYWDSVCDEQGLLTQENTLQYWMYAFNISKFAELIDTLLLILKHPKRPVPFLHWYHHMTVLLFVWYSDVWKFPGIIFIVVNATIHMFMYFYYFLKESGYKVSERYYALPLTVGQISQMFLGMFVNGSWIYMYYVQGRKCACQNPLAISISCAVMYGSYLYLFLSFFYGRYIVKKSDVRSVKKEQ